MQNFLETSTKQFEYYKMLGDKAMAQVSPDKLTWTPNFDNNSIATIVKHLWGNMRSRWTDFLTTDGEKEWRNRDTEFEEENISPEALKQRWEEGWSTLFSALRSLQASDLERAVYIRHQGHTVMEAILRQIAHYSYHVGQIVLLAKQLSNGWESLSIPKGGSDAYNAGKFEKPQERGHFTDEFLPTDKH